MLPYPWPLCVLDSFKNFLSYEGSALLSTNSSIDLHFPGNLVQKIDKMYAAFTGQPIEKVQQYTERDRFLSVAEVTFLSPSFPLNYIAFLILIKNIITSHIACERYWGCAYKGWSPSTSKMRLGQDLNRQRGQILLVGQVITTSFWLPVLHSFVTYTYSFLWAIS